MQKIENYGFVVLGEKMNLIKLYIACLSIIITLIVMFTIDALGLTHPIAETINEINEVFYV